MVVDGTDPGKSQQSLPSVLFGIWEGHESGRLRIHAPEQRRDIHFDKGDITVDSASFDEDDFVDRLRRSKIGRKMEGEGHNASSIRGLIDLDILSPRLLWKSMEMHFVSSLISLFDEDRAVSAFTPETNRIKAHTLFRIPTLDVLRKGLRRMTNHQFIQALLPPENMEILRLAPDHEREIPLDAHEIYILDFIDPAVPLKTLYEKSQLGREECQKVLFSLLTFGLIGPCRPSTPRSLGTAFSPLDVQRILTVFNKKCVAVLKYTSKEIGPVAWSFLQKCLDETTPHLPSPLQNLKLAGNGRLITDSVLKNAVLLTCDEARSDLLAGLNEILVAMVLTVKKNLGDEHETLLINILKKTGEDVE